MEDRREKRTKATTRTGPKSGQTLEDCQMLKKKRLDLTLKVASINQ